MHEQHGTQAQYAAEKQAKIAALRAQHGMNKKVEDPGGSTGIIPLPVHGTKRMGVEGPTGDGPLYPRIRELESKLDTESNALISMRIKFQQQSTEVRRLTALLDEKTAEVAQHVRVIATQSEEVDVLRASKGAELSSQKMMEIACNIPGFIIESARHGLNCSGIFEGQPKQTALATKILAQLNPCFIPRYIIVECNRSYKDVYAFLRKSYGASLPDLSSLESVKDKKRVVVDYFRVNCVAYTGTDANEFIDPYVTTAFGMTLCMDELGMRQYLSSEEMEQEYFKGWVETDGVRSADEMAHLSAVVRADAPQSQCASDDDEEASCPPGWRRNVKVSTGGRVYYTYSGPNGVTVNSRRKMMKSAVVQHTMLIPLSPPASPAPQEEPPMEKVTPRLATVARLQGLSPENRGNFHSVAQLFNSLVPLSPLLTRTKSLFLSLAAGGVFRGAPVEEAMPIVPLSRVAFNSKKEEEFAKQTAAIAAWRIYTGRKFERFMMGDNELDYWQVPSHDREGVLMKAYRANAGPSGANLDRTRNMLISFTKYKTESRIAADMQWPAGSGLIMAFISWRQNKTKSDKLGVSIPADIKASFVRCRLVGMQHQVKLDGAVLYNTCRKGVPLGGSEAAASTSIRMTCHWEDRIVNCKHEASLHALKCMVLMCHLSLRSIEFKRSKMRRAHYKGERIVNLIVSLSKQGAVDMWAGMHPYGFLGRFDWFEAFDDSMQEYDFIMHAMNWEVGHVGDVSRATINWGVMADDKMFAQVVHWCFLDSGLSAACITENKFTGYSPRHMYTNVAMACQWNNEAEDGCGRWRAAFHAAARDELRRMAERYASDEAMGRQLRLRKCVVVAVTSLVLKYYRYTSLSLMPDFDILCESAAFATSSFKGMLGGAQSIEL